MPFKVEFDPIENLIIARALGKTNITSLIQMLKEIIILAKQVHCFRILTRLDEADLQVDTMEFYFLPNTISKTIKEHGLAEYNFKRAFVGAENQKLLHFYETVTLNSGFHTKMFSDIEEAKEWLRKAQCDLEQK